MAQRVEYLLGVVVETTMNIKIMEKGKRKILKWDI